MKLLITKTTKHSMYDIQNKNDSENNSNDTSNDTDDEELDLGNMLNMLSPAFLEKIKSAVTPVTTQQSSLSTSSTSEVANDTRIQIFSSQASPTLFANKSLTSSSSSYSKESAAETGPISLKTLTAALAKWEESVTNKAIYESLNASEEAKCIAESLEQKAAAFGFQVHKMPADGNCFFHALIHQLQKNSYPKILTSLQLREVAVRHILDNFSSYSEAISEDPNIFINKLMQSGEWADHIIIQALSRELNITLFILRNDQSPPVVMRRANPIALISLGYQVGLHYQSLIHDPTLPSNLNMHQFINQTEIDQWNGSSSSLGYDEKETDETANYKIKK